MSLFKSVSRPDRLVSAPTEIEVRSAIRRRERLGDLTAASANAAIQRSKEVLSRLDPIGITSAVISESNRLLDSYDIRALDSLQLATAVVARTSIGLPITFVASDHRLLVFGSNRRICNY